MDEERVIRRSLRWTLLVSLWLLVVPGLLLVFKLLVLPSDHLQTVPWSSPGAAGPELQPMGDVPGIRAGDTLLAVNGVPASDVLASRASHPVRAGEVLTYRVRHGSAEQDVPVVVHKHLDVTGLFTAQQPDAALATLAILGLGIWLVRRRPGEPAAHAFLLFAAGWASSTLAGWAWTEPLDFWARPWVVVWADLGLGGYLVSGIATLLFALTFPSAAPAMRRHPWTAVAALPLAVCAAFAAWVAWRGVRLSEFAAMNTAAEIVWQVCALTALVVLVVRWVRRRRDPESARRIQIVVLGFSATLALILLGKWLAVPQGTFGFGLLLLIFPVSVAVAIAKQDLFELNVALNRGLVAAGTGSVLLAAYLAVAALTAEVSGHDGPLAALPAAGLVAVAFAPVRNKTQSLVTRRLFGTADDPQLVLHRLGLRLESSDDPESLLAAVVDTAAESLRLPYVAVELSTEDGWRVVRQHGTAPAQGVEHFDIHVAEQVVGRLAASPRGDARSLSPLDRQLLSDLARHSGVSARVVALLTDLRTAQHRLLVAREEERHRIHRDLHDGLGPSLVGLTLQLEVAADLAGDGDLGALTRRLHGEAARATDDVRRLVRDLRPGELEELGLPAAVAAAAARLSSPNAPRFDLDSPARLPDLAAEVEDAAYKICLEAMTNVIRHSSATACRIRLHSPDATTLHVEVADNGCGLRTGEGSGTGLQSMHERAVAVGGRLEVTGAAGQGTTVHAALPTAGAAGS